MSTCAIVCDNTLRFAARTHPEIGDTKSRVGVVFAILLTTILEAAGNWSDIHCKGEGVRGKGMALILRGGIGPGYCKLSLL